MIPGPAAGSGIVTPDLQTVLCALERFDPAAAWNVISSTLLPMLPRSRAHPGDTSELVRVTLPPGLVVGFGLDLGPAVAFVGKGQLEPWGIGPADLVATALDNVRARASALSSRDLVSGAIGEVPVEVLQSGASIAAALLLAPDELVRLLGPTPKLLAAPMRDVLLIMPDDIEIDAAAWIAAEFARQDPNGLDLGLFRSANGAVAQLTPRGRDLPVTIRSVMH